METQSYGNFFVLTVMAVFGLVTFVLWLWSLIHCVGNRRLTDTNRIIGVVLIVVLGLLGSLIYFFLPREPDSRRADMPIEG